MFARAKTIYTVLVTAAVAFFGLAWIPNDSSFGWAATLGWFGMMLSVLLVVLFSIALGVHRYTRRSKASVR